MNSWLIDGGKFLFFEKFMTFLYKNLEGYKPPYPGGPNPPISFPKPPKPQEPSFPTPDFKGPILPIGPNPNLPRKPFGGDTYPDYRRPWKDTVPAPARRDPLVLDLNRDGKVELKNAAFFDLNANGFHEFTRWIDKTDAFLVLDKNFNGKADDGGELFGDAMTLPDGSLALTGFDALRAYDSNGDGKIDASDEIYASLKVLTGEGKMSSLADAGGKSLSLASEAVNENTPSS